MHDAAIDANHVHKTFPTIVFAPQKPERRKGSTRKGHVLEISKIRHLENHTKPFQQHTVEYY